MPGLHAWLPSNRWRGNADCPRGRSMSSCCARSSLLLALAAAACAQPSIDRVVERARSTFDVPGIAVAVVKDGKVVVSKGYGVRRVGRPEPVTAHSLFRIASDRKSTRLN